MTINFWELKQITSNYLLDRYDHIKLRLDESQYHGVYVSFYWDKGSFVFKGGSLQCVTGWDPDNEHIALANAIAKLCMIEPDLRQELYPQD